LVQLVVPTLHIGRKPKPDSIFSSHSDVPLKINVNVLIITKLDGGEMLYVTDTLGQPRTVYC